MRPLFHEIFLFLFLLLSFASASGVGSQRLATPQEEQEETINHLKQIAYSNVSLGNRNRLLYTHDMLLFLHHLML